MKSETPTVDIDALLAQASNGSTAGCKITGILETLDDESRRKLEVALMARKPGCDRQYAYVEHKLVQLFLTLAPESKVTGSSVSTYRKNHRG